MRKAKSFPFEANTRFPGAGGPSTLNPKTPPQLMSGIYHDSEFEELKLRKKVPGGKGNKLVVWVRNEPFELGLLPVVPCPKLSIPILEKCMTYIKQHEWTKFLSLSNWYHICTKKLRLDWDLGWTLIRFYDLLFQQFKREEPYPGYWDEKCMNFKDQKRGDVDEFTVPTLPFLLFLYIQHSIRIFKEISDKAMKKSGGGGTSANVVNQGIPNLKISAFQETIREVKIGSEIIQCELVKECIGSFVEFLEIENEDKDIISSDSLDSLNFILCATLAPDTSDKPIPTLEEAYMLSNPDESHGFVNRAQFIKWIKQNIHVYPWGPSGCRKWNYTDCREPFIGVCDPSSNPTAPSENCILWNRQDPPNSWYIFSNVNDQLFYLPDLPEFTNLKIHRCNKSYFYLPSVTTCVVLDKVVNCTIYLGPVTKICRVTNCEKLKFTGIVRQLILCNSIASHFGVFTTCPNLLAGNGNKDIVFGPYDSVYPRLLEDLSTGRFGVGISLINHWNSIFGISMDGHILDTRKQWKEITPELFCKLVFPFPMPTKDPIYNTPVWREDPKFESAAEEKTNALEYWNAKKNEAELSAEQKKLFGTIMFTRFLIYLHDSGQEAELVGLKSYYHTLQANKKKPAELKSKVLTFDNAPSSLKELINLLPLSINNEDIDEAAAGEGRSNFFQYLAEPPAQFQ